MNKDQWRRRLDDSFTILLVGSVIGITVKLTTFLGKNMYLPFFPNILDHALLVFVVVYFAVRLYKKRYG